MEGAEAAPEAANPETPEKLIVAVEDEWGLWPSLRASFEARLPLKAAVLNNRQRKPVTVEALPLRYIPTTDSLLRSRPANKKSFWFKHPYATIILVVCQDLDEYRLSVRTKLQLLVKADLREWIIVHVIHASPADPAGKQARKVFSRIEDHFRRERCVRLELYLAEPNFADVEGRILDAIRTSLDSRIQAYGEDCKKMADDRATNPAWAYCAFAHEKESLALMLEMAQLRDDSLREYDDLEAIYLETVRRADSKIREFGGGDVGDERAAILDAGRKPVKMYAHEETIKQFDYRQYLFARKATLLFGLGRTSSVAERAHAFILEFSREMSLRQRELPFCTRELWVLSAAMSVTSVCAGHFSPRSPGHYSEKEFFRVQGDLFALARNRLLRLGDLVGLASALRVTPCTRAALSFSPWPQPAVWPSAPPESDPRVRQREKHLEELAAAKEGGKPGEGGAGALAAAWGVLYAPLCALGPGSLVLAANRCRGLMALAAAEGSLAAGPARGAPEGEAPAGSSPATRHSTLDAGPDSRAEAGGAFATPPRTRPASSAPATPAEGTAGVGAGSATKKPATPLSTPRSGAKALSLAQIQVAASIALESSITSGAIKKALTTRESFEELYAELTKAASESYLRSHWRRHAVALEAELGALQEAQGRYDLALLVYEKQHTMYSAEKWHALLLDLFPRLASCQQLRKDLPGYLASCVKLLSQLDRPLAPRAPTAPAPGPSAAAYVSLSTIRAPPVGVSPLGGQSPAGAPLERVRAQRELVDVARSRLEEPLSIDVSALLGFVVRAPQPLPVELGEGESVRLQVAVWSSFPQPLALDSLLLSLVAPPLFAPEEGIRLKSEAGAVVLQPGPNVVSMAAVARRQGLYLLGMLMGHCGRLRLRSSSATSREGVPEAEDFYTAERPLRTILTVLPPKPVAELLPSTTQSLLLGEEQWVGVVVRPVDTPPAPGASAPVRPDSAKIPSASVGVVAGPPALKGAFLRCTPGPGLVLPMPQMAEVELVRPPHSDSAEEAQAASPGDTLSGGRKEGRHVVVGEARVLPLLVPEGGCEGLSLGKAVLEQGAMRLPAWDMRAPIVVWLRARAVRGQAAGGSPQPAVANSHSPSSAGRTGPLLPSPVWSAASPSPASSPSEVPSSPSSVSAFSRPSSADSDAAPSAGRLTAAASSLRDWQGLGAAASAKGGRGDGHALPAGEREGATGPGGAGVPGGSPAVVRVLNCRLEAEAGAIGRQSVLCERSLGFTFCDPFTVALRTVSRGATGRDQMLQISLRSHLCAPIRVLACDLQLQPHFRLLSQPLAGMDAAKETPRTGSAASAGEGAVLTVAPGASGSLLCALRCVPEAPEPAQENGTAPGGAEPAGLAGATGSEGAASQPEVGRDGRPEAGAGASRLLVSFTLEAQRREGPHCPPLGSDAGSAPMPQGSGLGGGEGRGRPCVFSHSFLLAPPKRERRLCVGLAVPPELPCMGSTVVLEWSLERLAPGHAREDLSGAAAEGEGGEEEVGYEVWVRESEWMIAGRRKGFLPLALAMGSRAHLQLTLLPILAGYLDPPKLILQGIPLDCISVTPTPTLLQVLPA